MQMMNMEIGVNMPYMYNDLEVLEGVKYSQKYYGVDWMPYQDAAYAEMPIGFDEKLTFDPQATYPGYYPYDPSNWVQPFDPSAAATPRPADRVAFGELTSPKLALELGAGDELEGFEQQRMLCEPQLCYALYDPRFGQQQLGFDQQQLNFGQQLNFDQQVAYDYGLKGDKAFGFDIENASTVADTPVRSAVSSPATSIGNTPVLTPLRPDMVPSCLDLSGTHYDPGFVGVDFGHGNVDQGFAPFDPGFTGYGQGFTECDPGCAGVNLGYGGFGQSYLNAQGLVASQGQALEMGCMSAQEERGGSMFSDEHIIDIANEIANNVRFLPEKDGNGKYSLDKNHPIHCVWRDLNRGHCSWRCRWWHNGKRLSKNFNVKRFGDFEAMRMAIAMKLKNSRPVERLQLYKEQREAVRNHLGLLSHTHQSGSQRTPPSQLDIAAALPATSLPIGMDGAALYTSLEMKTSRGGKDVSDTKRLQRENWERIAWTYIRLPERYPGEASVVCKLCSKTTHCSRSRNLQQAHIMHLIRMHKNPWRQYLHPDGLTKMCRAALTALYEQHGFDASSKWRLRTGLTPPANSAD